MSKNTLIATVVVVVLVLAGWYFIKSQKGGVSYTQPAPAASPEVSQPTASATSSAAETTEKNAVNIESSGFLPKDITIRTGESVTWVNIDTVNHQVKSAVHPAHLLYPPLNTVDLLKTGEKKSLAFPQAGTYKYHDHLNPTLTGSVTVE